MHDSAQCVKLIVSHLMTVLMAVMMRPYVLSTVITDRGPLVDTI